jgi:hypothetical protein
MAVVTKPGRCCDRQSPERYPANPLDGIMTTSTGLIKLPRRTLSLKAEFETT